MLYNNQSPVTVALLVPNRDAVLGWLRARDIVHARNQALVSRLADAP
jgi:hypothetical protein